MSPHNAITDVPGVLVGHHERIDEGWATGTTVVLVPDGAVGGVDSRGGAPGTRETTLLRPWNLVQQVHGVCLSGGSAYGLAAADGVMRWLSERHHGFAVGTRPYEVVPIVPAAVLFDLPQSAWGNRPDAAFGYAASEVAGDGVVAQGCVGAGTGARAGALKGGIGSASTVLPDGTVVAALVAVNAYGEVVELSTGRPWALDHERGGEFRLRPAGRPGSLAMPGHTKLNTTIGVVATDAALDKAQCHRLAAAGQDGLTRAIRPAHSMFDGDTVFALATGVRASTAPEATFAGPGRAAELDRMYFAAAEVFARAVVHGVLAAYSLAGLTAYRDAWPGAMG
ncbi:MAG: P1 family peptidase [Sciscionella sp.]